MSLFGKVTGPQKTEQADCAFVPAADWVTKDSFAFGFVLDTFTCFGHFSYINNFILLLVGLQESITTYNYWVGQKVHLICFPPRWL